jgi:hypothetical protein
LQINVSVVQGQPNKTLKTEVIKEKRNFIVLPLNVHTAAQMPDG